MLVKEAIKYLNKLNADDEIMIGWWSEEDSPCDTDEIPWSAQCEIMDDKFWDRAYDEASIMIEDSIDDYFNDKDTEHKEEL